MKGPPPSIFKRRIIKRYQKKFGFRTFVETGTYLGDTIFSVRRVFKEIYSVELDPVLYERLIRRFRREDNVHLLQGDSASLLGEVMSKITTPALIFLDAHFCGAGTSGDGSNCPISEELRSVLTHPVGNHLVLIDDAIAFVGEAGYPTMDQIRDIFEGAGKWHLEVRYGMVHAWRADLSPVSPPSGDRSKGSVIRN